MPTLWLIKETLEKVTVFLAVSLSISKSLCTHHHTVSFSSQKVPSEGRKGALVAMPRKPRKTHSSAQPKKRVKVCPALCNATLHPACCVSAGHLSQLDPRHINQLQAVQQQPAWQSKEARLQAVMLSLRFQTAGTGSKESPPKSVKYRNFRSRAAAEARAALVSL